MSNTRSLILNTIQQELKSDLDIQRQLAESPDEAYARIPRNYKRSHTLDREHILELFYDRLRDYDSEIVFTDEDGIADAVTQVMNNAKEDRLLVPSNLPEIWLPSKGITLIRDNHLTTDQIEGTPTVLTDCSVAIAMSGTICLQHGGTQGRRALTLLPDHHLCVIRRDQVVETISEAMAYLDKRTGPITTIAGPSATSDIEMTRIRGVHGPRRLTAIML